MGPLVKQLSLEDQNKSLRVIMKKQKRKLLVSNIDQRDGDDSK